MLRKMEHSRWPVLTLLVVPFKTILTLIYYERPAQERHMGYPGPERKRYLLLAGSTPSEARS
jgi:hypothetical protein